MEKGVVPKKNTIFISPAGHPRDRIIIHESPEIPREGIFLSLNGYAFQAKAGVEIDLPRPVRKMLDTRIRTELRYGDDGKQYAQNISRFTYTLVKEDVDQIDPAIADAALNEENRIVV